MHQQCKRQPSKTTEMCPEWGIAQQLLRAEGLLKHDYDHPNRYLIIQVRVWKPEGILSSSEGDVALSQLADRQSKRWPCQLGKCRCVKGD